ncbi:MAG: histidine triad nucleotide-binding protein [Candidatus Dadabacteria bacterium]|nr:MAG: histidine triad nucleotide-binding protein [Candidatus Dadabacteria bacterium]
MELEHDIAENPTIFGKILRKEIPAEIVHEDIHCLAFKDIQPVAPHHILIIPKRRIEKLADVTEEQRTLLGHLLHVAAKIAREQGFAEDGFRVVINNGERASQSVFHLHLHLMGGREFGWPPG